MRTFKNRLLLSLFLSGVFGAQAITAHAAPVVAQQAEAKAPAHGRISPLQQLSGLQKPVPETAVHLSHARVVLADYPLIKHDFGDALEKQYNKKLAQISNEEIDKWLIDSSAYMSKPQANQTEANSEVPTDGKTTTAYRPFDYGRALVFNPAPGVLIDVKGSGGENPHQGGHSNGLATLGETIREFAFDKMVHKVLDHSKIGTDVVGHYAVIDTGFNVKWNGGGEDPAGLILRQAHSRAPGIKSALGIPETKRIEETLRQYGITSAGAYQENSYDLINLQGTANKAVLDFGGFLVMPEFHKPAYHFDYSPAQSSTYKPLLSESNGSFPQPNAKLRVPFETWGYTVSGNPDPVADNPWIWSHELARSLRNGRASRADAEQHMHNLMDEVDRRLQ
jgi:hypothetical protein